MTKNTAEVATLVVNGQVYRDWTSVMVQQRYGEYFPTFTFECSEFTKSGLRTGASIEQMRQNMKIVPGDIVEAYLAGRAACFGYVSERHVAFDANNHGVRIVGVGKAYDLVSSSTTTLQSGSMDGASWTALARKLAEPYGVKIIEKGAVDNTPFDQIHVQPGEIVSQALERYARMRKIVIGSSPYGDLLAIGDHSASPEAEQLIEGKNILRANCVIRDDSVYSRYYAIGQRFSNDSHFGDQDTKQVAWADGSAKRYRPLVVPVDVVDKQHGVQQRAEMEKLFCEGTIVEAHITVQGWIRNSGGDLWTAGHYYRVQSPMLLLDNVLGTRCVTFEQDEGSGTTTTLEMVNPYYMNGRPPMSGPLPGSTNPERAQ
jgi:prophage tail gpP-like protein